MSFFNNVWSSDSSSEDFLKIFSGYYPTSTGVNITPDNAMRHSIVYSCVRVLSESISSLPLVLYKEDDNGNRKKAKEHTLYGLLNLLPNQENTTMQWRETMMANLCLKGNHFSQIIRNKRGQIISIWGLDTNRITVKRKQNTGELVFLYDYGFDYKDKHKEKQFVFNFDEVLNVSGLSFDGITGISPIAYERESIALSVAMEQFGGKYFKNGASATGAFSVDGELTNTAYERLKKDFDDRYTGLKEAHRPLLLEGGAKFTPISMSNQDSQFLEARKFQKEDISMIFRVPPHMLNDLAKANYNSIEQLSLSFVIYSLTPYLTRIEQCMQRDLLTEDERKQGYYIRHNLAGLLRGDMKTRFEVYDKAVKSGIYTLDDVLKLEDMNQLDNEAGKARFMQGAMTTVENIIDGVNYKNNISKNGVNENE
ncbi:phage portal protein [Aliarcobacter lanthieri]|uniref:phage portal protein n=1 Tax=Aliarcobacter lanthieri TaxID=1355374 RepID=UPI003AAB1FEE